MACIGNCKLCNRLIISQSLTYEQADNVLQVNLPGGSYGDNQRYCVVVAQSIPDTTTLNAQVQFTIGEGTTTYPFVNRDGTPIYASQLRTRRVYPTRVNTAVDTGVFKYIGNCSLPSNSTTTLQALPVETVAVTNTGETLNKD